MTATTTTAGVLPEFFWKYDREASESTFRFNAQAFQDLRDIVLHASSVLGVISKYAETDSWEEREALQQEQELLALFFHLGFLNAVNVKDKD
jgi:hypothetical protein